MPYKYATGRQSNTAVSMPATKYLSALFWIAKPSGLDSAVLYGVVTERGKSWVDAWTKATKVEK